ncbi:MAG: magnesium-translocating P-type ATPase [Patescibacteria group bacterium]
MGLTTKKAKELLKRFGPNLIQYKVEHPPLVQFLLEFKNPLIFILIIAAVISFFMGEWVSSIIIILMVLLSTVLDFVNTYKSQKAANSLKEKVRVSANTLRDGKLQELPVSQLVPGDVVLLEPGDVIPADGKVIIGKDFFVDESTLTGESYPLEKLNGEVVFMGSSAVTGDAKILIEQTGKNTKFSHIAEALLKKDEMTDFDRGIQQFSYLILKVILILVVCIFLFNIITGHNSFFDAFLFALALAVGLTPELLPMIITFNLSKGSLALAKEGVIVKKLSAIQNFGSMDILCTDKTGTLTDGKIALVKYTDGLGKESDDVLLCAYINSFYETGIKNPLDNAVREFRKIKISEYKKVDEIPFDYVRRRGSIVVDDGSRIMITKGVPEEIFKISKFYQNANHEFAGKIKTETLKNYESLSRDGFRVLAVAKKVLTGKKSVYSKDDEGDMIFMGFIAFLDPPKLTVTETLKVMEEYGIEIKILTGDNELVTQRVAQEINLKVKGVLSGAQIANMSMGVLEKVVEETTIFARLSPDQKTKIIKVLQKNGHVVGYLGDGINDSPALKAADAGISVNNAVDVAKESADLILLRKSLRELVNGVIEGRKTFSNTIKYLMMNLSSNFGNMFSLAGASLFLPFLPMLPSQVLLNNLMYDTSQFTIPLDNVDKEDVKKPRKWDIKFLKKFMLIFGPVSSIYDFATFIFLFYIFHLNASAFQSGWFLESLATQTLVVHIIRTRKLSFIKSRASWALFLSTFAIVVLSWFLVFSGWAGYFGFTALNLKQGLTIVGIVIVYLINVEVVKKWFFKRLVLKM